MDSPRLLRKTGEPVTPLQYCDLRERRNARHQSRCTACRRPRVYTHSEVLRNVPTVLEIHHVWKCPIHADKAAWVYRKERYASRT